MRPARHVRSGLGGSRRRDRGRGPAPRARFPRLALRARGPLGGHARRSRLCPRCERGFGRTGRWFAALRPDERPEVILSSPYIRTRQTASIISGVLGNVPVEDVEEIWHGLAPPYRELFAWLEGEGFRPVTGDQLRERLAG